MGATDTDLSHLAGHQSGVGRGPAPGGENALRCDHPAQILRGGFLAGENDLLSLRCSGNGGIGGEVDVTARGPGPGRKPASDGLRLALVGRVEDRGQEVAEILGRDAQDGFLLGDEALPDHIERDVHRRKTGALAVPGLQHPELALLDGELDVLHVPEVLLEDVADLEEFLVGSGKILGHPGHLLGGPDPGHHVLTLGVDEVLAVKNILTGGGVAGECHPGPGIPACIPENHGLDVHGRSPAGRDPVFLAIDLGPIVVPGIENGVDGAVELLHRVFRKSLSGPHLDELLELRDHPAEILLLQSGVVVDLGPGLGPVENDLVGIVVFMGVGLHPHHHAPVHLQEATVAVPGELGVAGPGREGFHHPVIDSEVEDGVHHAGHRLAGAGADREEERILEVAEFLAHGLLDLGDIGLDLALERFGVSPAVFVVVGADLRGDGEPGRHGNADAAHLGKIRPLAPQKRFLIPGPVRLAVTKVINVLALPAASGGFASCLADGPAGRFARRLALYGSHES